jgi:hypothetical protein
VLRKAAALAALSILMTTACGDDPADVSTADCALPTPRPNADASMLDEEFVPPESEAVQTRKTKDRISALLNLELGVQDGYDYYRAAVKDAGYEIVGDDFEGFEAEVYIKRGTQLGTIQIRTSRCKRASVVFINLARK